MSDHGLDGGPAAQLAFDLPVDATLLARPIDAQGFGRVVAHIALVDIGPFDLAASDVLGFGDDGTNGVLVFGPARERLGVERERAGANILLNPDIKHSSWSKSYNKDIVYTADSPAGNDLTVAGRRDRDGDGAGYWYSYADLAPQRPATR